MIVPFKKYRPTEIEVIRARYPDLKLPGMVTRANMDGTIQFVPWQDASGGGGLNPDGSQAMPDRGFSSTLDNPYGDLPVRTKRTPLQQMTALRNRVRKDFLLGHVMKRDEVANYTDKARAKQLRAGAALTEADLDDVIKAFIKRAEDENEAKEARKITRASRCD
jgi:hypothetical protein